MFRARLGVGHSDGLLHIRRKTHQGGQNRAPLPAVCREEGAAGQDRCC